MTVTPLPKQKPDPDATEATRRRYQRLSPIYDVMEGLVERRYHPWRIKLWSQVPRTARTQTRRQTWWKCASS